MSDSSINSTLDLDSLPNIPLSGCFPRILMIHQLHTSSSLNADIIASIRFYYNITAKCPTSRQEQTLSGEINSTYNFRQPFFIQLNCINLTACVCLPSFFFFFEFCDLTSKSANPLSLSFPVCKMDIMTSRQSILRGSRLMMSVWWCQFLEGAERGEDAVRT